MFTVEGGARRPEEDNHFDWAEFEQLIARDSERVPPYAVPAPSIRPSGAAAAHLDSGTIEPESLADAEVIDAITGFERVIAWVGARQARLLAEFAARRPGEDPAETSRWAPDEIALALSQSRITATAKLAQSVQLHEVLGDTLHAWETGRLDALKVRAISDATLRLDQTKARAVQNRVLPRAEGQTFAQLKAALKRAVLAVDPDGGDQRHNQAKKERRIVLTPVEDGMATLWAFLTAPHAQACYGWLTALARGLGKDDPRGMDARRADLLRDLLTGHLTIIAADVTDTMPGTSAAAGASTADAEEASTKGTSTADTGSADTGSADTGAAGTAAAGISDHRTDAVDDSSSIDIAGSDNRGTGRGGKGTNTGDHDTGCPRCASPTGPLPPLPWRPPPVAPGKPLVQIVVPLTTLTGADDHPVELVGYGPIPSDIARTIAADAVWKRLVTDPLSGTLLDHGRTTYRPSAALSDFVRARDQVCRFPPCNRRAIDIELDHTLSWTAGNGPIPGRPGTDRPRTATCTAAARITITSSTTRRAGRSPRPRRV